MKEITLAELAVDHDYYSSNSNYYSDEARGRYETFTSFYNEFIGADIDMNLIFRWDIKQLDDGGYYAEIFMIHQRKGIYMPHMIDEIVESEVPMFLLLIKKHWEKLQRIWTPISNL